MLFWNCWISQRATVPAWYFLVFLTLPAWRNCFWGALPPMVGQSFLLTGSSPKADGLDSTAIWANCQVGDNDGDLPISSSHLASSTCLSASSNLFSSSLMGEGFLTGDGWCTREGGLLPLSVIAFHASLGLRTHLSPPSPSLVSLLFLPFYKIM